MEVVAAAVDSDGAATAEENLCPLFDVAGEGPVEGHEAGVAVLGQNFLGGGFVLAHNHTIINQLSISQSIFYIDPPHFHTHAKHVRGIRATRPAPRPKHLRLQLLLTTCTAPRTASLRTPSLVIPLNIQLEMFALL